MTQTHQSVDDFLMGGGYTSAKFPTIGTLHKGTVIEASMQQQRTMDGKPKFWDSDGSPMMQARIVIQTDERDPNIADDDGVRALYIKGESQKAVREAVKKAGAKSIEPGGMIALKYVADGKAEGNLNPPKLYVAEYRPPAEKPAGSLTEEDLL